MNIHALRAIHWITFGTPDYLTVQEVVERLSGRISACTVYSLIRKGKLRGVKIAGRVLVEAPSLDELLRAGRVAVLLPSPREKKPTQPRSFRHFSLD